MPGYVEYEIPDLIEIRDKKESVKSSVIKRWNVHFLTEDELNAANQQKAEEDLAAEEAARLDEELARADKEAEELRLAQEIFERLEREAAEDREKELEEQRMAYAIANGELPPEMYNAATNSYSGVYGTKPMDEDTKAQLDEIMRESSQENSHDVSALFAESAMADAAAAGDTPGDTDDAGAPSDDAAGALGGADGDELAAMAEQALFDE